MAPWRQPGAGLACGYRADALPSAPGRRPGMARRLVSSVHPFAQAPCRAASVDAVRAGFPALMIRLPRLHPPALLLALLLGGCAVGPDFSPRGAAGRRDAVAAPCRGLARLTAEAARLVAPVRRRHAGRAAGTRAGGQPRPARGLGARGAAPDGIAGAALLPALGAGGNYGRQAVSANGLFAALGAPAMRSTCGRPVSTPPGRSTVSARAACSGAGGHAGRAAGPRPCASACRPRWRAPICNGAACRHSSTSRAPTGPSPHMRCGWRRAARPTAWQRASILPPRRRSWPR